MIIIAKINLTNNPIRNEDVVNQETKLIKNETTAIAWIEKASWNLVKEETIGGGQENSWGGAQAEAGGGGLRTRENLFGKEKKRGTAAGELIEEKTLKRRKE